MKYSWIISVFGICVVLPWLLFSMVRTEKPPSQEAYTEITTEVSEHTNQISVLMLDGTVRRMPLETYIVCVVLKEMPTSFHSEALKAQAVVARTYTLKRLYNGSKHIGAAICADPSCCQGYCDEENFLKNGGDALQLAKVREAVSKTKDYVLTYNGELIEATYFSCSGGMTEDALAVWGSDIPYLQAKESLGEENASHFTDTVSFSEMDFLQKLGIQNYDNNVKIKDIQYTEGGGVASLQICEQEFSGVEVRKLLGLRSTAFTLNVVADHIIITTRGFGHRVGMSQYGADAMAVRGSSFEDILSYYYTGTELSRMNPMD